MAQNSSSPVVLMGFTTIFIHLIQFVDFPRQVGHQFIPGTGKQHGSTRQVTCKRSASVLVFQQTKKRTYINTFEPNQFGGSEFLQIHQFKLFWPTWHEEIWTNYIDCSRPRGETSTGWGKLFDQEFHGSRQPKNQLIFFSYRSKNVQNKIDQKLSMICMFSTEMDLRLQNSKKRTKPVWRFRISPNSPVPTVGSTVEMVKFNLKPRRTQLQQCGSCGVGVCDLPGGTAWDGVETNKNRWVWIRKR